MSDRLTELQRQRALIQGHLTWLDQEIAAAKGKPATLTNPAPWPSLKPVTPAPVEGEAHIPEEIIAKFNAETIDTTKSVRKGCFTVFFLALALFVLGVFGLYLYSRNLHKNDPLPSAKSAPESSESR